MQQAQSAAVEEETQWTDDSIRWTAEENTRATAETEEEGAALDIFQEDPRHDFIFSFPHPDSNCDDIHIQLRGYKAESDEIYQSTGLTLWKASEYLCRYYLKKKHHSANHYGEKQRILELGAGLGLVGILMHLIHTSSTVCVTDGDTNALAHLRDNLQRNSSKENSNNISCHQLLWGHDSASAFLEKQHGEKFDVILASDILYAPCVIEPLWETIRVLLSRKPEAVFVMAFAKRDVPVTIDDFIEVAPEFDNKCMDKDDEEGVFVYEFWWKEE